MLIAKVVKSNSHVDYVGRVLDRLDAEEPPLPQDYRFGQFVSIPSGEGGGARDGVRPPGSGTVGIIYNSQLVNPDYERLGPRLSSPIEMNTVFSPDLLNEQGVLIGVLLLGWVGHDATPHQGVPSTVIPVNSEILNMSDGEVRSFHLSPDGRLALHYYPHVMTHARQFAQQLLLAVLDQLEALCGDVSKPEIDLLRRTLNWQLVFQNKSL
ncbi:MAG TPA: hypothetical protein VJX67_26770 [Blastocatellia bacterium]|nr:hypothetical protein [Blastocatellia bacterium]